MQSSHHWPGMAFAFLMTLLSPKGAAICKDCFLEEDGPEPDYDWETVPGMDLNNVYKPPVLSNIGSDDDTHEEGAPSPPTADELHEDSDNKLEESRKKRGAVHMTCSITQFIKLLKELLCFHAWYKYGEAPFGPDFEDGNADKLQLAICKMLAQIVTYCPRLEGNKWKLAAEAP